MDKILKGEDSDSVPVPSIRVRVSLGGGNHDVVAAMMMIKTPRRQEANCVRAGGNVADG